MQSLHVVALVERVDDGLPVRVDDRRAVAAEAQLVEVVRREQRRQRIEELEQRLGVGIHVDEHEPAPALDAHAREREVVGQADELFTIGDAHEPAVERVRPRVVRAADLAVRERAAPVGERRPAVPAGVVEPGDRAGLGAHDHDRVVADRVLEEVARRRELLLPARDLPHARPQAARAPSRANSAVV